MSDIIKAKEIVNQDEYKSLLTNIESAIKESKQIIIFDESDVDKAGFYIKKFKELDKKIETVRKNIVSPINDEVKEINKIFKLLQSKFTPEIDRLTNDSNEILKEVRKRQEELLKKEQRELEDAVLDEAEMFNDLSVIDNIPQVEYKQEKLKTDNLTTVRVKKWRVIDINLVPIKYLTINEGLINQLRKGYDFEVKPQPINGLEFYYEENVRVK